MSAFACSINRQRAFVAGFICAAFLWALALGASSQLHQRVHPDANRAEHSCAVTMVASGSYNHAAQPPIVSQPEVTPAFSQIAELSSTWVRPLFLDAHIFAHAPPARA
jgi:hypothetical protein